MKHGLSQTSFWRIHATMKSRCTNPNVKGYKNYGGRGIRVCSKWQSIEGFAEDMLSTYSSGLSIERKDVNGDYCPENCIWISKSDQWKNKRNSFITFGDQSLRLAEWAKELGISKKVIWRRRVSWNITLEETIKRLKNEFVDSSNGINSFDSFKGKTYVKQVFINGARQFHIIDSITHEVRNII